MKPHEIDELIADAESGKRVLVQHGSGPPREVGLDELRASRDISAYLESEYERLRPEGVVPDWAKSAPKVPT